MTFSAGASVPYPTSTFTPQLTALLDSGHPLYLTPENVAEVCAKTGIPSETLPVELLPVAASYARPPISNYSVGAIGRGSDGSLYLGCNLEFPGIEFGNTVHAEQFVVANAMQNGAERLAGIFVNAEPCGHCRQFLFELLDDNDLDIFIPGKPAQQLSALLPHPFGPGHLGITQRPLSSTSIIEKKPQTGDRLVDLARMAAYRSYSPIARRPAGIALRARGEIYSSGSRIENAAFNPTLPAFQAALIGLVGARVDFSDIEEAVVAELEPGATLHHAAMMLANLAPQARISHVPL